MADKVEADRQWALILVAGGNEAYNRWDTLEETVQDKEEVEQVWQAFEKSFEQSSSFWHFRDAYLGDVRQDDTETTADLDLRIKQIVKGCQWPKETMCHGCRIFVRRGTHKLKTVSILSCIY